MRILFMGTPDFAAESLRALLHTKHNIVGAVTQPDKPKGRGQKLVPCEVKKLAVGSGIPVFQPQTLKNGELRQVLEEKKPELIVVAAYGKILPPYVISYPKYGCVNVHGSLLPKYRGAAPIQRAVLNGETETGITTMLMDNGLDTGDILLVKKTDIGAEETSAQLFDRLAVMGGELLTETVDGLEAGAIIPVPQTGEWSYAHMIKKEEGIIDWTKNANEILNLVRGMNSWPMASTFYEGTRFKVVSALYCDNTSGTPGKIAGVVKGKGLKVYCGDGSVFIKTLQFPGSKRMEAEEYMRGHDIKSGVILGK